MAWVACGATPGPNPGAFAGVQKTGDGRPLHELTPQEHAAIRRLLPRAVQLQPSALPAGVTGPSDDQGNYTLYTARAADGATVGWARPMSGPVTAHESCPCSPLVLTLVFDERLALLDIVAPAPLSKWGHQPLSPQEHRQMVAIANQPAPELLNLPGPNALVADTQSNATQPAFAHAVVPQAALSTHRIATWTAQTRAILRNDPLSAERQQVALLLRREAELGASGVSHALGSLLPTLTSASLQSEVFSLLANRYFQASQAGAGDDPQVEAALLAPGLPAAQESIQVAQICAAFAREGQRMGFVRRCLATLRGQSVPPALLRTMQGAERFAAGDHAQALPALQEATSYLRPDAAPKLYLSLAQSAQAMGNATLACSTCELLYVDHARLPGLAETMSACRAADGRHDTFVAGLEAQAKSAILREERPPNGPQAAALSVTDAAGTPATVQLREPGHITVVMFFATWCPHCRKEMPLISDFARACQGDPALRGRVQIVGVHTAARGDAQPLSAFLSELSPAFPVYADSGAADAFTGFARSQGLPLALPTVAVLDEEARIRFLLRPGDDRDVAQELKWMAERLLAGG